MKKMNTFGDSRMISIWMFIILGIIVVVIAMGVFSYFSGSNDVRVREAKTLSDRLVYGIAQDGYLKDGVIGSGYNILNAAGIESRIIDNEGFFYFNVSVYEGDKLRASYLAGNGDFEIQCRLSGNKLAKCYWREFFLINKTGSLFKVKILTGSNAQPL